MNYRVVITENAKSNLRAYYLRAAQHAPLTAARWLNRFEQSIATLSADPQRCALAAGSAVVESEIHQLLVGKRRRVFRVLFTIIGDDVQVLHIRRGAMDTATSDELYG